MPQSCGAQALTSLPCAFVCCASQAASAATSGCLNGYTATNPDPSCSPSYLGTYLRNSMAILCFDREWALSAELGVALRLWKGDKLAPAEPDPLTQQWHPSQSSGTPQPHMPLPLQPLLAPTVFLVNNQPHETCTPLLHAVPNAQKRVP